MAKQIGEQYGDFVIESRNVSIQREKHSAAKYFNIKCQYCGKIKTIRSDRIKSTLTCKCRKLESLRQLDTAEWEVLELTDKKCSDKSIVYKCQCKNCRNIDYIASNVLKTHRKHCSNCYQRKTTLIDLTGKRYGTLEVLERDMSPEYTGHEQDAYWKCLCHNCGSIKSIRGISLRNGLTQSCGCIKSRGEEAIAKLLIAANQTFAREFIFPDLYTYNIKNKYRFDFAVFNSDGTLNYLIEYDGEQHFSEKVRETGWNNQENYIKTKERDMIKNNYCINHHIKLIRIRYDEEITLNKVLGIEPTQGGIYGVD